MNKWVKRATAVGLCAVFCAGGVCAAFAQATGAEPEQPETNEAGTGEAEYVQSAAQAESSKDETVYVLAAADGTVQKIIVSDWIKNTAGSDAVADRSDLTNIENVKGGESYAMGGGNTKVWDAQGNDIYYQGEIEKELPVSVSVTCMLDGKPVSAQELAGKSGRVTIRFDYQNRQYEMVEIGGAQEKIYVPFAALTGMMLDSGTFRNVEVSNGKLINDGDHIVVAGLAFPGLQENLALDGDSIEIPSYVEITADVTDFEFGMTVTVVTNEVFNELDGGGLDSADSLSEPLGKLTDAAQALLDGSSALYDGLCTLLDKSGELTDGISRLAEGAKSLKEGAGSLGDGAAELSSGLNKLSGSSASLNSGAAQVFETLLSTATAQIREAGISIPELTIGNYADVLNGVIASLDENAVYNTALGKVTDAVEANRENIAAQVTAAVRARTEAGVAAKIEENVTASVTEGIRTQVTAQTLAAYGMSQEEYETADPQQKAAIDAEIDKQMATDAVKTAIAENTEAQMHSAEVQAAVAQNVEEQIQKAISDNMASDEVQNQLAAASGGAAAVIGLKTSLDSYNAFYTGLNAYTGGVDAAASGAAQLQSGAAQLEEGAKTLYEGALTLKKGIPALTDGIKQLRDGAMELSDGMKQFSEEGLDKLAELAGGDLEEIAARLRATLEVSQNYRNFAGIGDGMDGRVKFVYRTEEIRPE